MTKGCYPSSETEVSLCEAITWSATGIPWTKTEYAAWASDAARRKKRLAVAEARPLTPEQAAVVGDLEKLRARVTAEDRFQDRLSRAEGRLLPAIEAGFIRASAVDTSKDRAGGGTVLQFNGLPRGYRLQTHLSQNQLLCHDNTDAERDDDTFAQFHHLTDWAVLRKDLAPYAHGPLHVDKRTGLAPLLDASSAADPSRLRDRQELIGIQEAVCWFAAGLLWTHAELGHLFSLSCTVEKEVRTKHLYDGRPASEADLSVRGAWLERRQEIVAACESAKVEVMDYIKAGRVTVLGYRKDWDSKQGRKDRLTKADFLEHPVIIDLWSERPFVVDVRASPLQRADVLDFLKKYEEFSLLASELREIAQDWPNLEQSQQEESRPPRQSRRPGRGFREQDIPLVHEMDQLLAQGEVSSLWQAALKVLPKAAGFGTEDSKLKRLVKRFQEVFPDWHLSQFSAELAENKLED